MRGHGEVIIVPDLVSVDAGRLRAETYADQTVLHVVASDFSSRAAIIKRSMDLVISLATLALASPIIAVAAWKIRREDGGPVFFRQQRVGLAGEEFTLWKLRTMSVDAESRLDEVAHLNKAGPYQTKMDKDPRITRIGNMLRRTSIDELPQLINVVRGDMSLVGPRPALPVEVALYPKEGHRRHRVRPGLTGLWQVSGRSDLDSQQALALDLHYVANWSLGKDLSILVRTVRVVLGRSGAQ
jgi:exopolysaccharide biosynthesis polyprenyl glycosylphosphotransferase